MMVVNTEDEDDLDGMVTMRLMIMTIHHEMDKGRRTKDEGP